MNVRSDGALVALLLAVQLLLLILMLVFCCSRIICSSVTTSSIDRLGHGRISNVLGCSVVSCRSRTSTSRNRTTGALVECLCQPFCECGPVPKGLVRACESSSVTTPNVVLDRENL